MPHVDDPPTPESEFPTFDPPLQPLEAPVPPLGSSDPADPDLVDPDTQYQDILVPYQEPAVPASEIVDTTPDTGLRVFDDLSTETESSAPAIEPSALDAYVERRNEIQMLDALELLADELDSQLPDSDVQALNRNFKYHSPTGDQPARYLLLRNSMRQSAELILRLCPESPERTLALRALETASMWANASIARGPQPR